MGTGSILIVVCELFLFYLRGVSFARVYCQSIVIVVMFDLPCALRLPVDASSRARVACERAGLLRGGFRVTGVCLPDLSKERAS